MARQLIDTTTNNGTYIGDPAKIAFGKVNSMTEEIYGQTDLLQSRTEALQVDTDELKEQAVLRGEFGAFGVPPAPAADAGDYARFKWIMAVNPSTLNIPEPAYGILRIESSGGVSLIPQPGQTVFQTFQVVNSSRIWRRQSVNGSAWSPWVYAWDTGTTTVDSNNFIKRA